jgi:hypothetical protein
VRPSQSPGLLTTGGNDVMLASQFLSVPMSGMLHLHRLYSSYLYGAVLNYIIKLRDNILKLPYLTDSRHGSPSLKCKATSTTKSKAIPVIGRGGL